MPEIPKETWLVDFEFCQPEGERPRPSCMVARAFHSGETKRVWLWDNPPKECPIPLGSGALYVAYFASAEIGCHLSLGWPVPVSVLDLYAEFRLLTSGRSTPAGRGLLGALTYFGLGGISGEEKAEMRALAMRGGTYTEAEKVALLDYCETDVVALAKLLPKMWAAVDLPRALIRGRYMAAVARVERCGVPVDVETLGRLRANWEGIQDRLIEAVDCGFGVYEGRVFKRDRWLTWCAKNGITWPRLESGAPDLKRQTFRDMAAKYPELHPVRELRTSLAELRLNALAVGEDGRNRYMVSPFGSKTGRNQPSNSKAIYGPSAWIRSLIKPEPERAVGYIDWAQQELGIAAKLSGDPNMMEAYRSGDPYLSFARMAGAVPVDATKTTHPKERGVYKVGALAVLMGMGAAALGFQTGTGEAGGFRLLRQHRELFPKYWEWSENGVNFAEMGGTLKTVYGWQIAPFDPVSRPTTYRNFRLQANGADMLRLASIAITERGLNLCAMVHDAVLIEAASGEIEEAVAETQKCMAAASRAVLGGFELGTDAEVVRWPDRYQDGRGKVMWERLTAILEKVGAGASKVGAGASKVGRTSPPVSSPIYV